MPKQVYACKAEFLLPFHGLIKKNNMGTDNIKEKLKVFSL